MPSSTPGLRPGGAVERPYRTRDDFRLRAGIRGLHPARRHASDAPQAILLRLDAGHELRVFLSVLSDGEPIPAEVEPFLFEPFFSTRSRGTGLGLYICRELCERYGASIEYRLRPHGGSQRNGFFVDMKRATLSPPETGLHPT